MNIISLLSFYAFISYGYLFFYSIRLDPQKCLNRSFSFLAFCFCWWAFCYTFLAVSPGLDEVYLWYRLSVIGWALAPIAGITFAFSYTRKYSPEFIKYLLIPACLPPLYFLIKVFVFQHYFLTYQRIGGLWVEKIVSWNENPDFVFLLIYIVVYSSIMLLLLALTALKTDEKNERDQTRILWIAIVIFGILEAFNLASVVNKWLTLPDITHILGLVWLTAFWMTIRKYNLFKPVSILESEEIISRLNELLFVIDRNGFITRTNLQVRKTLGYPERELLEKGFENFIFEKEAWHRQKE